MNQFGHHAASGQDIDDGIQVDPEKTLAQQIGQAVDPVNRHEGNAEQGRFQIGRAAGADDRIGGIEQIKSLFLAEKLNLRIGLGRGQGSGGDILRLLQKNLQLEFFAQHAHRGQHFRKQRPDFRFAAARKQRQQNLIGAHPQPAAELLTGFADPHGIEQRVAGIGKGHLFFLVDRYFKGKNDEQAGHPAADLSQPGCTSRPRPSD